MDAEERTAAGLAALAEYEVDGVSGSVVRDVRNAAEGERAEVGHLSAALGIRDVVELLVSAAPSATTSVPRDEKIARSCHEYPIKKQESASWTRLDCTLSSWMKR